MKAPDGGGDGIRFALPGAAVAAEADHARDGVLRGEIDRGDQFGLDALVLGGIVQADRQAVMARNLRDGQAVLPGERGQFGEILIALPDFHGGVADGGDFADEGRQGDMPPG